MHHDLGDSSTNVLVVGYGLCRTYHKDRGHHLFVGPLMGGGAPMSPVDFKKWQCPLSLF